MERGGRRSRTARWGGRWSTSLAFRKALQFYVDLVRDAGESDAARASYNQCLAQYLEGKVAMWYDATVAAGLLEADDSPVKGKNGYAPAPVERTSASGWLWSWALAILSVVEQGGPGLEVHLVGDRAAVHQGGRDEDRRAGGRRSRQARAGRPTRFPSTGRPPVRSPSRRSTRSSPRRSSNPGTSKRPGNPGVQYVGIPEFQDVGDQCTELFSAVIVGKTPIDSALENCQNIASRVGQ